MPSIRVEIIGPIALTSAAASGWTPESAMMKPITVPVRPSRTRLLAMCLTGAIRAASRSRSVEARIARLWPSRPSISCR
jgi:hypothetical protein